MGVGFTHQTQERTDIVHTEICTLHNNPLLHDADQLVAQTLFADGFIKYSVFPERQLNLRTSTEANLPSAYFKLLGLHQQTVPQSSELMTWKLTEWGFHLVISKEVPVFIARGIQGFIHALCAKSEVVEAYVIEHAIFAIHPGGPKIVRYVQQMLGLKDSQIQASLHVLQHYGNMSSATLPHIWKALSDDPDVPAGTLVISLAFGPGLTIAGSVLQLEKI
jgi:predicted naringenin-chalcone synthase